MKTHFLWSNIYMVPYVLQCSYIRIFWLNAIRMQMYTEICENNNIAIFFLAQQQGQMLYVRESDSVIFLCYPSVMNLDDLTR